MQILAKTGPRGRVVPRNATRLAQPLPPGTTTLQLEQDPFLDGQSLAVGEEELEVVSHGLAATVLRARGGTVEGDHPAGANVRLAGGTELVAHTFDGVEWLSAIRCAGECEALFGLELDGVLCYLAPSSPYALEVLFPMARYQPAAGCTLRVLVWSWTDRAVFWAELQS